MKLFKLRGEVCIGFASLFSFTALLLLIFTHVGQINTSSVPRGIAMAKMNVSLYGQALENGFGDPINGLYTSNASAPLQARAGIRQQYEFGLYSYCAYIVKPNGTCTNTTIARRYQPYTAFTSDMYLNYSQFTDFIINGTSTFKDSTTLGGHTHSAYYLILLGTIFTFIALVIGVIKHTFAFLISATFAALATLFILVGAALWTSAVNSSEAINGLVLATTDIPLGIEVTAGTGLSLLWAAFGCLVVSLVPYMIRCATSISPPTGRLEARRLIILFRPTVAAHTGARPTCQPTQPTVRRLRPSCPEAWRFPTRSWPSLLITYTTIITPSDNDPQESTLWTIRRFTIPKLLPYYLECTTHCYAPANNI
ncbi:hypothetical protein FA95DRAFT_1486831 [Auriscalpium vulgare]|uniref:Uncharacterized protein n=1 Tax=Auriscalpium vulgare TaxID=40419 RepID=A0ACB8S2U4_9AGAM|nr:hypothetical protein FA95DRAFT_1486831 [Auriscalpium vulgare]